MTDQSEGETDQPRFNRHHALWHDNEIPNIQCFREDGVVATVPQNIDAFDFCPMCGQRLDDDTSLTVRRIAKASIDREQLEHSDESWNKILLRQCALPLAVLVMWVIGVWQFGFRTSIMAAGIGFFAYSALPALGVYFLSQEAKR